MIPIRFADELREMIEEGKRFLEDLRYYDVSSSNYLQVYIAQKIHQLGGMLIRLEEYESNPKDTDIANMTNMYQVFLEIKTEITLSYKKWKRQVEYKYRDLKTRIGKLYFMSSLAG